MFLCRNCGYHATNAPNPPALAPAEHTAAASPVEVAEHSLVGPGAGAKRKATRTAKAALVLGIASWSIMNPAVGIPVMMLPHAVGGWFSALVFLISVPSTPLAIIFGILGIRRANADPAKVGGRGLAVTGLALGLATIFFWAYVATAPAH